MSEVITSLPPLRNGRLACPVLETNFTCRHAIRSDVLAAMALAVFMFSIGLSGLGFTKVK